jgi:murein DD-endopeptidase MepM/ murein hydrolase activator NlpD
MPDQYFKSIEKAFENLPHGFNSAGAPDSSPAPMNVAPGNYKNILSSLGTETTPYGGNTRYETFHHGVDIANSIGTPIPAISDGIVEEVVSGKRQGDAAYGNYVKIRDSYGNVEQYAHLDSPSVAVGQKVSKGSIIGRMGNTGATYSPSGKGTGAHLDLRIWNAYKKYVNPYSYMQNSS